MINISKQKRETNNPIEKQCKISQNKNEKRNQLAKLAHLQVKLQVFVSIANLTYKCFLFYL